MLSRHNLHAYQNKAVDFILSEKRCMLALEMGLGKTTSTLTAVCDMLDSFTANKVLVVAPLRVANMHTAARWYEVPRYRRAAEKSRPPRYQHRYRPPSTY